MPNEAVGLALIRYKYRKEFGLTAEQMDNEPLSEVAVILKIWQAQDKREKLEQKRAESKRHSRR